MTSASASASVPYQVEKRTVGTRTPPRSPRTPLEADIEQGIIQAFFYRHRITLWKIDAGGSGFRSGLRKGAGGHSRIPAGFPDLLGVIQGGLALFIEVKRPGEKPRKNQADFLARLRDKNAVAFWADSVDAALAKFDAAMADRRVA